MKFADKLVEMINKASYLHDVEVNQKYDSDQPYSIHLKNVLNHTIDYLKYVPEEDYDLICFAALFHDAIEDARQTYNDIIRIAKMWFDEDKAINAAEIVYALTNEKGRNRHERANEKYYQGIREIKYAPLIKACDRMANTIYSKDHKQSLHKAYIKEMEDFIANIYVNDESLPTKVIEDLKNLK